MRFACMPTCLPARTHACTPACPPARPHIYALACLPLCLPVCPLFPACLPALLCPHFVTTLMLSCTALLSLPLCTCLQGTVLPGPLQKEASVRVASLCSTVLGGPAQPGPADFASCADAGDALPRLAGEVCRQAADAYASAMRLQVGG